MQFCLHRKLNIQTVVKGTGYSGRWWKLLWKTWKLQWLLLVRKSICGTPSRKKIFQSISQNITNLKVLFNVRQSPKSRTMESSARTSGVGKKLGRAAAFPALASASGARLNHETLLEPAMRQEKRYKLKKNIGTATITKPILWNWLRTYNLSEAATELDKGVNFSLGHLSMVDKTDNFGCDDSLN